MKKLIITSSLILILGLISCKKETVSPTLQEEIVTGKPTSPPPPPSILQWQNSYGNSSSEMGYTIAKSNAGNGYVFVGSALSNGGQVSGHHGGIGADAWVVKINNSGTIDWQKCLGGTEGDYAYDIIPTTDGGYIFSGASASADGDLAGLVNHGGTDIWVVKLSSSGNIEWQKSFGGNGTERGNSIIQTSDGGYLISSSTNSTDGDISTNHGDYDAWIIRLNSSGNLDWQKTFGGTLGDDAGSNITPIAGGFILCGSSESTNGDLAGSTNHGGLDTWVFKIDLSGNLLSSKTYGGSGGESEGTIYNSPDGGYIFSVNTSSNNGDVSGNHGYSDTWVVKVNAGGTLIWQKCFGGFDMDRARIRDIDALGNIVLVGYTFSKNGDIPACKGSEDLWVLRLDGNGNKLFSNVLGGKSGDMANDAIPTDDGMYITAGRSNSTTGDVTGNHGGNDVWVVKFKF